MNGRRKTARSGGVARDACLRLMVLFSVGLVACHAESRVRVGADVLIEERLALVKGKRVGLITNQTGRLASGKFLVDTLLEKGVAVVALFGPEHGIRGDAEAGRHVADTVDMRTGIPLYSLYGKVKKPTSAMLKGVDVLVYDIQDVGARFYTYISTMTLAMEAAAEMGLPFIVLDRPNPLGGVRVEGPVLEDSLKSFVGMLPIPIVYGLTCGELASMINVEGWLANGVQANLIVVEMIGWRRSMSWEETGLSWIPPSPNIPAASTATVYPATCFIEATNVSEGRGTARPFHLVGAPFVDAERFAVSLNSLALPGVLFSPASFTPTSSKFEGKMCYGVSVKVVDPSVFSPVNTGLHLFQQLYIQYPDRITINASIFARLAGVNGLLPQLVSRLNIEKIITDYSDSLETFRKRASRYKFYD